MDKTPLDDLEWLMDLLEKHKAISRWDISLRDEAEIRLIRSRLQDYRLREARK